MIRTLAAIAFIGLNFYTFNYLATNPVYPERTSFEEFPLELGVWKCPELGVMDAEVGKNLGVTDYLMCRYHSPEYKAGVGVYIGYHQSQVREEGGGAAENSIHPPAHCLPGSGWDIVNNQTVVLDLEELPGGPASVKRLTIAKGRSRQLVYYWYQSRGRVIAQDWQKVVYVGLDRALQQRTDGSLVRFTIPIINKDDARAQAVFEEVAPLVLAQLRAFVPE